MAWRSEKNGDDIDIVIDGFENGIADDPYEGFGDMRNINILSTPKEAPVGFANAAIVLPPVLNATNFSVITDATYTFNYLAVGGGGNGGTDTGTPDGAGGGGGGQVATGTYGAIASSFAVVVGAAEGTSSVFGTTALAGGRGGASNTNGLNGASGGGAGGRISGGGASKIGGTGSPGFNGGDSTSGGGSDSFAGGGGGAGGIGGSKSNTVGVGGTGGIGLASSISGASVLYGGGGGGGVSGVGTDGGGTGGSAGNAGTAGTANHGGGGGGGGSSSGAGGAGGTGVVIISIATGTVTNPTTCGGVRTTSGGNDIWTFTSSGTFTPTFSTPPNARISIATTTGFYNGMAVIINSVSGGTGLSSTSGSNTYYVGNITATTFILYTDLACTQAVVFLATGTGTLSTAQFGKPFDSNSYPDGAIVGGVTLSLNDNFILDDTGQVWMLGNGVRGYALNTLQFLGNTNHSVLSASGSLGIAAWKGYLLVFIQGSIDYISLSSGVTGIFGTAGPNGNWHIAWKSDLSPSGFGHKAISATDDAVYFCNSSAVGSLLQNAGTTFDPTSSSTYTYNAKALALPTFDFAHCLAQLGVTLLVGGVQSYIYPWDRTSPSFSYPLVVAESFISRIVSTNATAYIFAGNRGRIYQTNGANIQLFKKFPDQLSNTETPYYTWGDALYLRNQLYFGISCTTNAGVAINNFAGVWSVSLEMGNTISSVAYGSSAGPLKMLNALSYGSYTGTVPVIMGMGNVNPAGNGIYVGWVNGSSVGGLDYSTSNPYTNYEAYFDTDIIPIGTYYEPSTDQQIEYKLAKPLVAGESIRIAWRGNLTDSFTTVTTFTTIGQISDAIQVNFQKQQWVQLRVSLVSTATTPSFNRVREIRLR